MAVAGNEAAGGRLVVVVMVLPRSRPGLVPARTGRIAAARRHCLVPDLARTAGMPGALPGTPLGPGGRLRGTSGTIGPRCRVPVPLRPGRGGGSGFRCAVVTILSAIQRLIPMSCSLFRKLACASRAWRVAGSGSAICRLSAFAWCVSAGRLNPNPNAP